MATVTKEDDTAKDKTRGGIEFVTSTEQTTEGDTGSGGVDFQGTPQPRGEGGSRREEVDGATNDRAVPLAWVGGAGVGSGGEVSDEVAPQYEG